MSETVTAAPPAHVREVVAATAPARLWYLATPYSKYPGGLDRAFHLACEEAGRLIAAGVPVFSPIAHSHPIALAAGLDPLDHTLWLGADKPLMDACSGLVMLMADSWCTSFGMRFELGQFRLAGKPVVYMAPGAVPAELLR